MISEHAKKIEVIQNNGDVGHVIIIEN